LAEISKISAVAIANVAKVDAVLKANIADINGLTIPSDFTGLLDETFGSGAALAFSVRRLAGSTTILMRVRRDTGGGTGDDDEADVAYDSNNELSLDSAISNASAGVTATTLGQFINVGTVGGTTYTNPDSLTVTASCFVDEWKDQSGNANDAAQSTQSEQPRIHDGTADTDIEKEIGKPGLDFRTVLDRNLRFTEVAASGADCTISYVGALEGATRELMVGYFGSSSTASEYLRTSFRKINFIGFQSAYGSISSGLNAYSIMATDDASAGTIYRNNTSIATGTTTRSNGFDSIGGNDTGNAGYHSEVIIWESVKNTSDLSDIYGNQNTYFQIV